MVFCVCGWHYFGFLRQVYIRCLLSSPFVICLTINLKRGAGGDCWNNIYFHLDKYHIFWIHFEFSLSDGKLVKFCIEPQIWKIVAKFSVPLLSHDHTRQSKSYILLNTSLLNWIPRTVVQRCRQQFSHSKETFSGLLHFVPPQNYLNVTLLHHWVKLLGVSRHTMGLSLTAKRRGEVIREQAIMPRGTWFMNAKLTVEL